MNTESPFDLTGKVAVVTGGGDGIGKGACEILAAAGASVVVSDLSAEKAQATADGIVKAGGKATATACNVLEEQDLKALIDFAVKIYGTVNILVNNAGPFPFGEGGAQPYGVEPRLRLRPTGHTRQQRRPRSDQNARAGQRAHPRNRGEDAGPQADQAAGKCRATRRSSG